MMNISMTRFRFGTDDDVVWRKPCHLFLVVVLELSLSFRMHSTAKSVTGLNLIAFGGYISRSLFWFVSSLNQLLSSLIIEVFSESLSSNSQPFARGFVEWIPKGAGERGGLIRIWIPEVVFILYGWYVMVELGGESEVTTSTTMNLLATNGSDPGVIDEVSVFKTPLSVPLLSFSEVLGFRLSVETGSSELIFSQQNTDGLSTSTSSVCCRSDLQPDSLSDQYINMCSGMFALFFFFWN
jgi:hypothetical protein